MIRLALRVRSAEAEIVLAELIELAPTGVEEVDLGAGVTEFAIYGAPGELPALPDLRAVAGGALVDVHTSELPDDWSERWRAFHHPVLIEPSAPRAGSPLDDAHRPGACGRTSLYVRPPWAPPAPLGGAPGSLGGPDARAIQDIVIDPAQAFGTGAHATTRMCLVLLLDMAAAGLATGPLLDVGCGSGVLAIAAARLGWTPIVGLDHERESVEATCENAAANSVAIQARHFDLRQEPLPVIAPAAGTPQEHGAPVTVVANLLRPLLLEMSSSMQAPPAHLIISGLLCLEVDEVSGAFQSRLGLRERERRSSGEWAAAWLEA